VKQRWSFSGHFALALDWLRTHRVLLLVTLLGLLSGALEWGFVLRENTPHKFEVDHLLLDCLMTGGLGLFMGGVFSPFLLPISLAFFTDPKSLGGSPASYELSPAGKRFFGSWIVRLCTSCGVLGLLFPISQVIFLRAGSIPALPTCLVAGTLATHCAHKIGRAVENFIESVQERGQRDKPGKRDRFDFDGISNR
jgi:hypothetical protein